uniref:Uncharacterized protein n=1 Tax=Octopus bimaculoides TaxID=37653 RepID=A0A0L8GCX6_OCTBM
MFCVFSLSHTHLCTHIFSFLSETLHACISQVYIHFFDFSLCVFVPHLVGGFQ